MLQYTTINDGLLAHLNELIEEGATNPGYDQDISSVLMAIAKVYEEKLTSEQKAALPTQFDIHQPGDAAYYMLSVMKALIPADEDKEDETDPEETTP